MEKKRFLVILSLLLIVSMLAAAWVNCSPRRRSNSLPAGASWACPGDNENAIAVQASAATI